MYVMSTVRQRVRTLGVAGTALAVVKTAWMVGEQVTCLPPPSSHSPSQCLP